MFVENNIICCRFARIVAHHPYVILVAVAVFAGTCLIIPLTTKKPPDFSDPQLVTAIRGNLLAQYLEQCYRTFPGTNPVSDVQYCWY